MARLLAFVCVVYVLTSTLPVMCDDPQEKGTPKAAPANNDRPNPEQSNEQNPVTSHNVNNPVVQPGADDEPDDAASDQKHIDSGSSNCTKSGNGTACGDDHQQGIAGYIPRIITENKDMLMRTFYVVISITGIIIVYFIVRMIRTRQRQSRTKRYGLLSSRDDHLEMTPLDVDDEEDDMTLFDVNQTK